MKRSVPFLVSAAVLLPGLLLCCAPLPPAAKTDTLSPPPRKQEAPPAPAPLAPAAPKTQKKAHAPYAYTAVDSASMGNEILLSPDKLVVENREAESDSADKTATPGSPSGTAAASIVDGFRIQVYATTDHLEAERKKEDLSIALDNKVYVVYEAPYYKIRAGNFLKEEDAKKLKKAIAELGYDAYIVKSKIRAPAQPR